MKLFTADFETTTDINDCRVWLWGTCNINDFSEKMWGKTAWDFILCASEFYNPVGYFHNLKFDGEFIIQALFEHGYKFNPDGRHLNSKEFTTLISDKGQFYTLSVKFPKSKLIIYDSLKILPMKVEEMPDAFNLPLKKLDMDYNAYRPVGHEPSIKELAYLFNDIEIPARALKIMFDQGLTAMTQGSNALADFKKIMGKKSFERNFPVPMYDHDVRQSYKGGYTYLNPRFQECGNWRRDCA